VEKILNIELLSEILKDKVKKIIGIEDNSLKYLTESYGFGEGIICSINLCVLRDIMEEWAFEKGYEVHSYKIANNKYVCEFYNETEPWEGFINNTKIEVITEACQWIYDKEIK